MRKDNTYDFESSWSKYALEEEENRFLSSDEEDLLKICDCIDVKRKRFKKTSGGIPIHYENGKLYVLKEGPHCRVEGESGSKKSRTIARGSLVSAVLNRDSAIITDPKGEICSDPKIKWLLKQAGVDTHVLDFRNFDKDGVNPLSHIFELLEKGRMSQANAEIDKHINGLKESHMGGNDPYWNDQAGDLIRFAEQILGYVLIQIEDGKKAFNLASVKNFICQDQRAVKYMLEPISQKEPEWSALKGYMDILKLPEKTYACVVSSANALLSEYACSDELMKMVSVQTFDIRKFYKRPSVLFLIVPDEHNAYNTLVGQLIDQFYQILVETYQEIYQNKKDPACDIKFICDEAANLRINDLSSKVSASRSRHIDWTLIFQSERQMAEAYKKDWPTICGNCKHRIYLGSSDYDILKNISDQVGVTYFSKDGRPVPLVSVEELRKMKKEKEFKHALLLTGNHIYCAELPDYDVYEFLEEGEVNYARRVEENETISYTPTDFYKDYNANRIFYFGNLVFSRRKEKEEEEEDLFDILDLGLSDWLGN